MTKRIAGSLTVVLLASCGPDRPPLEDAGASAADSPDSEDDGTLDAGPFPDYPHDCESADLMTNPYHCGECERSCIAALGWGECVGGECGSAFVSCKAESDGLTTCDAICGEAGRTCSLWGCGGATMVSYPQDGGELCATGTTDYAVPWQQECGEPIQWGDDVGVVTCCCLPAA